MHLKKQECFGWQCRQVARARLKSLDTDWHSSTGRQLLNQQCSLGNLIPASVCYPCAGISYRAFSSTIANPYCFTRGHFLIPPSTQRLTEDHWREGWSFRDPYNQLILSGPNEWIWKILPWGRVYDPLPRERIGQPSSADTYSELMQEGKTYWNGRSC